MHILVKNHEFCALEFRTKRVYIQYSECLKINVWNTKAQCLSLNTIKTTERKDFIQVYF